MVVCVVLHCVIVVFSDHTHLPFDCLNAALVRKFLCNRAYQSQKERAGRFSESVFIFFSLYFGVCSWWWHGWSVIVTFSDHYQSFILYIQKNRWKKTIGMNYSWAHN